MTLRGDSLANSVKIERGLAARIERGSAQRARGRLRGLAERL